jgi:signal transduction histidine kinase
MMDCIPLHRHPTSIAAMVRQIVALMEPFARDGDIRLKAVIDDGLPAQASIDEDKIAWALGMLIGNALRHVPRGSYVHAGGEIVVRASVPPGTADVVVEVADNGPGIPEDRLALLLQPAPYQRRLGYALILARDIADAHGGRMEITSSRDPFSHGTTVRIVLPATQAGSVPSPTP